MFKIDPKSLPPRVGSSYPAPFHEPCANRVRRSIGKAGGLTEFGVNLLELPPGAWSSQRHWHTREDEFVYVLSGEVTLISDQGEQTLRAGDCACFPKNVPNGHQVVNRSDSTATLLEVGTSHDDDVCTYSDIDMRIDSREDRFTRKDGTPYPPRERK